MARAFARQARGREFNSLTGHGYFDEYIGESFGCKIFACFDLPDDVIMVVSDFQDVMFVLKNGELG